MMRLDLFIDHDRGLELSLGSQGFAEAHERSIVMGMGLEDLAIDGDLTLAIA